MVLRLRATIGTAPWRSSVKPRSVRTTSRMRARL
jgi:hypothetical protein